MGKAFFIDVAKCSGCYNCQFACKDLGGICRVAVD